MGWPMLSCKKHLIKSCKKTYLIRSALYFFNNSDRDTIWNFIQSSYMFFGAQKFINKIVWGIIQFDPYLSFKGLIYFFWRILYIYLSRILYQFHFMMFKSRYQKLYQGQYIWVTLSFQEIYQVSLKAHTFFLF